MDWGEPGAGPQTQAVTFSEHVAPILFKNCVTCHRPGEAGPFSLLTYQDAKTNGEDIADATHDRYMPPWKPAPTDYPFVDDRRMSDADIDTIQRWVKAGMPQGDPRKTPKPPVFIDDWALGRASATPKIPARGSAV